MNSSLFSMFLYFICLSTTVFHLATYNSVSLFNLIKNLSFFIFTLNLIFFKIQTVAYFGGFYIYVTLLTYSYYQKELSKFPVKFIKNELIVKKLFTLYILFLFPPISRNKALEFFQIYFAFECIK